MRRTVVAACASGALVLSFGLFACGGSAPAAESTAEEATKAKVVTPEEAAAGDESAESEEEVQNVDPRECSDELYEARLDAQHYMLDVTHEWEQESFFFDTRDEFEAAYQARVDELNARCEESKAIIDAMSDPDVVKQYYKKDLEDERDQYLHTMQEDYDLASANYA